jgi:hypothetical protein
MPAYSQILHESRVERLTGNMLSFFNDYLRGVLHDSDSIAHVSNEKLREQIGKQLDHLLMESYLDGCGDASRKTKEEA